MKLVTGNWSLVTEEGDRTEDRQRLQQRRNLLEISLKSLQIKPQAPAPLQEIPPVPPLPPADFSREEASVNKAALVVQQPFGGSG